MVTIGDPYSETPKPGLKWREMTNDERAMNAGDWLVITPQIIVVSAYGDGRIVVKLRSEMNTREYGWLIRHAEEAVMAHDPALRLYLETSGDINALRRVTRGIDVLEGFAGE